MEDGLGKEQGWGEGDQVRGFAATQPRHHGVAGWQNIGERHRSERDSGGRTYWSPS